MDDRMLRVNDSIWWARARRARSFLSYEKVQNGGGVKSFSPNLHPKYGPTE